MAFFTHLSMLFPTQFPINPPPNGTRLSCPPEETSHGVQSHTDVDLSSRMSSTNFMILGDQHFFNLKADILRG